MKKLFGFVLFLLLFTSALLSQAQVTTPSSPSTPTVNIEDAPAEIQAILKKDQKNWTVEEKEKMTSFILLSNPSGIDTSGTSPEGTVDCFDYYHFGSVQVDLPTTLTQTVPGATIGFPGEIKNANPYPIVNGQVYVKIFRQQAGENFDQENGFDLVDQFSLDETFNIPANGSKKTSFLWKVPDNTPAGDYIATFFFQTAKRYNLLGLSFTDDVVGNQVYFSVVSDRKISVVTFDKSTVTLNKQPHRFAAFPLHFSKDEPVSVVVKLVNPKNESVTVPIVWKLYNWDGLREENLKDTKTESVQMKPKEVKEISYSALPIGTIVSYLVVETNDGPSKSILNIRFVRDGIEETRINFPSIMSYPLEKNKENTLFSCVHAVSDGVVKDNTLTLTLNDEKGRLIHSYEYAGNITSAMMGVKDLFTPKKNYTTFSLTATLKHKGEVVEEVKEVYDCRDINPDICPKKTNTGAIVLGSLILLSIIYVLWTVLKSRKKLPISLALILIFLGSSFIAPTTVEAKSVGTSFGLPILGFSEGSSNPTGYGVAGITATVLYNATVTLFGSEVLDGSSIPTGATVRVTWNPSSGASSWVGTGGEYDSPYGRWDTSARSCTTYNECTNINYVSGGWYYIIYQGDMATIPPAFSVSGSGLSCGATLGGVRTSGPYNSFFCSQYPGHPTWCATVVSYSPFYSDCIVTASSGQSISMNIAYPATNGSLRAGQFISYDGRQTGQYGRSGGLSYSVPAMSLSYSFTAAPPSNLPSTPTLVYQDPSLVNTPVSFTATATDIDGDNVRYGFDWNFDTVIDEWAPAIGYVPSGTPQTISRTWNTTGTKVFYVRTQDSNNNQSANVFKTVSIVTTIVNGSCGPADGTTRLTTAPTSGLCNTGTPGFVWNFTDRYQWDCRGINGANPTCRAYKNKPPTATIISPATNITINSSQSQQFSGAATDADIDGSIVAYEWRLGNCTSGTLISSLTSFARSFVPGTYWIFFRAQDDSGAWSSTWPSFCQGRQLVVTTPDPIPGVCGSANGAPTQKKPTSGLCNTVGLPGPVVLPEDINILPESDPAASWTWTCAGEYGGASASCSSVGTVCDSDGVCRQLGTSCGDDKCQASKGENPSTCRADCRVNFFEF